MRTGDFTIGRGFNVYQEWHPDTLTILFAYWWMKSHPQRLISPTITSSVSTHFYIYNCTSHPSFYILSHHETIPLCTLKNTRGGKRCAKINSIAYTMMPNVSDTRDFISREIHFVVFFIFHSDLFTFFFFLTLFILNSTLQPTYQYIFFFIT